MVAAKDGSREQEAARLLAMHGKVIGFNPPGMAKALTYNGILFKKVGRTGGKYSVLIDEHGEAKPPRTWQRCANLRGSSPNGVLRLMA